MIQVFKFDYFYFYFYSTLWFLEDIRGNNLRQSASKPVFMRL